MSMRISWSVGFLSCNTREVLAPKTEWEIIGHQFKTVVLYRSVRNLALVTKDSLHQYLCLFYFRPSSPTVTTATTHLQYTVQTAQSENLMTWCQVHPPIQHCNQHVWKALKRKEFFAPLSKHEMDDGSHNMACIKSEIVFSFTDCKLSYFHNVWLNLQPISMCQLLKRSSNQWLMCEFYQCPVRD